MDKKKFQSIDEYIYAQDEQYKTMLFKVKNTIKNIAINAQEKISYGMPTFYEKENIIHFALMKNHLGIYPTPSAIDHFKIRLEKYQTSKGAIRMPLDEEIDYKLIEDIVKYRLEYISKNK